MQVIVHWPKTEAAQAELQKRVAQVHAAAVLSKIEKLACSKEQKRKLLETVKKSAHT